MEYIGMSFQPPGPPMPIPGMPPVPPMMPPPYAVPPMGGMIPMTMGMMPGPVIQMMAPVAMTVPTIPMPPHQKLSLKKMAPMSHIYRKIETDNGAYIPKGPPVTVFVGNITDRASDSLVRHILQKCGLVVNWKRVQGANGKLQAFGFCEYGDPESALRAIRLLHDWAIGDRKLVVKVDAKTKEKLDEYKATKWAKQQDSGEKSEQSEESSEKKEKEGKTDDLLDEETKTKDIYIRNSIQDLLRAHDSELSRPSDAQIYQDVVQTVPSNYVDKTKKVTKPAENIKASREIEKDQRNDLDEMDLEEDKKSLIHREIYKFRDTYKRAEEEKEKEKERKSKKRDHGSPERERSGDRHRSRERAGSRSREERRRRSRERERKVNRESPSTREQEVRARSRERERRIERSRSRSREREREREWSREREYSIERTRDKEEEEDDAYERKKIERKLREKEAAYQERLRNWEARERRKGKEYEKERSKQDEQKRDEIKESRRLKEFLEDYDDERDDAKYFKGSALARRLKEREKEIETDNYDRQKEKEELEELRRKLTDEGHPDPESEVKRILQEESRSLQVKTKPEPPDSDIEVEHESKMKPITTPASPLREVEDIKIVKNPIEDDSTENSFTGFGDVITTHEEAKPMGFAGLRLGGSPTHQPSNPSTSQTFSTTHTGTQKRKMTLDEVFSTNDDDDSDQKKKRKLIPLDDAQEDSKGAGGTLQMSSEEKRKYVKNLIDQIPTAKNELFAYTLEWSFVDKHLMEKRVKPWINKKIIEYIGEEEPTLVDFICSKVLARSTPQSILDDVSMVLDEEAEVFVVKMWRLLIYEIEAKKLGLMR